MASQPVEAAFEPPAAIPLAPIIVKKVFVQEAGHHGGAWKVAYADFVTAMMAFFLMLWLLGATTEAQRKGLADHFTPTLVRIKQGSAGSDGLLGGSSLTEVDNYPNRQGQTGNREMTIPRGTAGGPDVGGAAAEAAGTRHRALKEKIERKLQTTEKLKRLSRQVRVVRTNQGTRIDLVDDADFSMFALGTTVLVPEARELIAAVSEAVLDDPARIIVRGHTDALKWKPGVTANNWSLSAGRAEATRQAMLRGGIDEGRFDRIEGVADRELLVSDNPADPRNRRMSVLLVD